MRAENNLTVALLLFLFFILCLVVDRFMKGCNPTIPVDWPVVNNYLLKSKLNPCMYDCYNPSIYYDAKEEVNHIVMRCSNASIYSLKRVIDVDILRHQSHSIVFYQKMNKSLNKILESHVIEIKSPPNPDRYFRGLEDPRIIKWNDTYYVYGSFAVEPGNGINIMMVKLNGEFQSDKEVIMYEKGIQKNWAALENKGSLFFINFIPFILYSYDGDVATKINEPSNVILDKRTRGGSPTIPIEWKQKKYYLCTTHFNKFHYVHQFVVLSGEYPFNPISQSSDFTIDRMGGPAIEFSSGITKIDDDIVVTYGRFDKTAQYKKYKLEYIMNLCKI